jgi:hypothetical protein
MSASDQIQYGMTLSPKDRAEGLRCNEVYNKWYHSPFMDSDPETCSNSLLFYPQPCSPRIPDYRDTYRTFPTVGGLGYFTQLVAVYTGSTDLVITSKCTYHSDLHSNTDTTERQSRPSAILLHDFV